MAEHLDLTVIVNGTPTQVRVEKDAKVEHVIIKALEQTGNKGQPPSNWELRTEQGAILEPHRTLEHYHIQSGARLFLNLKAGVGG